MFETCRHGRPWDKPCDGCGRRIVNGRREALSSWRRPLARETTWDGRPVEHPNLVVGRRRRELTEAQRHTINAPIIQRSVRRDPTPRAYRPMPPEQRQRLSVAMRASHARRRQAAA
jgi:hypothetical protein